MASDNAQKEQLSRQPVSPWPLWLCLAAWAVAFFLPAYAGNADPPQVAQGWEAAINSYYSSIFYPIYGQAWMANIFMLLTPFLWQRAQRGKGEIYFIMFALAAIEPLGIPFHPVGWDASEVHGLLIGYYVWQVAILGMVAWYGWALYRRRAFLIAGAALAATLFFAPEYRVRLSYMRLIDRSWQFIAAIEQSDRASAQTYSFQLEELPERPGRKDLALAVQYLRDLLDCDTVHERVSDSEIMARYPGVLVRPPDTTHPPQPPDLHAVPGCHGLDESGYRPWITLSDMKPVALARAKMYLRNTEIDKWARLGRKQYPQPLSEFERKALGR